MSVLGMALTGTTIVFFIAAAYVFKRIGDAIGWAFQEYLPQPGDEIEQRVLEGEE